MRVPRVVGGSNFGKFQVWKGVFGEFCNCCATSSSKLVIWKDAEDGAEERGDGFSLRPLLAPWNSTLAGSGESERDYSTGRAPSRPLRLVRLRESSMLHTGNVARPAAT